MDEVAGKVAIVTGGGQGVGLGIARLFARNGIKLLLTGRHAEKLEAAAGELTRDGGEVAFRAGDAGNPDDARQAVAAAVERFGRLDILINNAQIMDVGTMLEEIDDATFDQVVRSGLYGSFFHMRAAFPHLKERGGAIVNLGSRGGIYGDLGQSAYAASKEGIRGLSRVAAREWGKYRIRVNVLCPASLSPGAEAYLNERPAEYEMYRKALSLPYFGDAVDDIAPVALFLCSDAGRYVTGQTINADGGQIML